MPYCRAVADGALGSVTGRRLALQRFVNGIDGEAFYQKQAPQSQPERVETAELRYPSDRTAHELVVRDAAPLASVVNLSYVDPAIAAGTWAAGHPGRDELTLGRIAALMIFFIN